MKKNTAQALEASDQAPAAPRKRGPKVDVELTRKRKAEILREAARLFDRVGYHGVNMEMIAEAAGLKKPTLYHYIRSKDQILFEIHETMIGALNEAMTQRKAEGAGPAEVLHGVFRDIFQLMHEFPGYVRAFFEHMRELQDERKDKVRSERRAYLKAVMDVVAQGMDQGLFNRGDVRVTAVCLLGICNWSYQWYRPERDPSAEEMADQCWDFATKGLLAANPPAGKAKRARK